MNKIILPAPALLLTALLFTGMSHGQTYQSQNISMFANWFDSAVVAEPFYGIKYNGIWGWADGNGKEYAIIGATHGTYIIEVTNPSSPELRDFVPGLQTGCIWREYKTYGNYLYMISDSPLPNGLQIADLSYLPDSVHVVHSSDSIIQRCHTLFIDGNKLYGGGPSGGAVVSAAAMAVYSLANPEAPQLLRTLGQDVPSISYVHDMFVRNDTIYASGAYQGLFILKFQPNHTFVQLASLTSYVDQGYNHSSALSESGNTLVFCDEVPGDLAVKALDVSDFSNLQVTDYFKSNIGATAHNPFAVGDQFMVIAYYKDGLRIFDISDPANVKPSGYFDTYWQNDSCVCYTETPYDYAGCWGAYPYLPSGNMLASDMQNGLFVLDASAVLGIPSLTGKSGSLVLYPNPVVSSLNMVIPADAGQKVTIRIYDIAGRLMMEVAEALTAPDRKLKLNLPSLDKGSYVVKVDGAGRMYAGRVIRLVDR